MDPIRRFQIVDLFALGGLGKAEVAFTNSAVFMLLAIAAHRLSWVGTASSRAVPTRLQSAAG